MYDSWNNYVILCKLTGTRRVMDITLNLKKEFKDHQDAVREISVHQDGNFFFSRSGSMLILYNFPEGSKIRGFYDSAGYEAAMFDSDGSNLIYMSDDKLHFLDLDIWKVRMVIPGELTEYRDEDMHSGVGLKANGKQNGAIEVRKIIADDYDPPEFVLEGHTNYIEYSKFHPNGKILATGSADMTLKFWDLELRKEIGSHRIHDDFVTAIAFNNDGSMMVTGDYAGTIKVWDINIPG